MLYGARKQLEHGGETGVRSREDAVEREFGLFDERERGEQILERLWFMELLVSLLHREHWFQFSMNILDYAMRYAL